MNELDVLSGGVASAEAADADGRGHRPTTCASAACSGWGIPRATPTACEFEFAIEGTVEGPLRDADQTGENAPITITLNLLSWPERQLLMNKRYRPLPSQMRATAHHFANEVIYWLTGEPGMCLSRVVFSRGTGDRRDLYVVDYDGEGLLRLTANRELNLCPSWSPDGSEIAFTSYRSGQQGLLQPGYRQRQGAAGHRPWTGSIYGADWHPDGQGTGAVPVPGRQSGNLPDHARGQDHQAADRVQGHRNQPQLVSRGPGSGFYQ